jgi:hypothetical protein
MTSTFELSITEGTEGSLAAMMKVDGNAFGEDCVDLIELRKSAIISGAYDLQTCGCGCPQCAGFWEPIFVLHDGSFIRREFDGRYHPVANKNTEMAIVHYEFDRDQYIREIQSKFEWLRGHPRRDTLGPHGFNPIILDEAFPDMSLPQIPFADGATIVLGYSEPYHQPWVWVEDGPEVSLRQLLPTREMWTMFGCWSQMWDIQNFDLRKCLYRKDSETYQLRSDVSTVECNQEIESLAVKIHQYWGASAKVKWDRISESLAHVFLRCDLNLIQSVM